MCVCVKELTIDHTCTSLPPSHSPRRVATAESLSRLLSQAVQSGDQALMEKVLKTRRERVVRQAIQRMPLSLILPFLRQVS